MVLARVVRFPHDHVSARWCWPGAVEPRDAVAQLIVERIALPEVEEVADLDDMCVDRTSPGRACARVSRFHAVVCGSARAQRSRSRRIRFHGGGAGRGQAQWSVGFRSLLWGGRRSGSCSPRGSRARFAQIGPHARLSLSNHASFSSRKESFTDTGKHGLAYADRGSDNRRSGRLRSKRSEFRACALRIRRKRRRRPTQTRGGGTAAAAREGRRRPTTGGRALHGIGRVPQELG